MTVASEQPKPTIPELAQELQRTRTRALEEVAPAVEEITVLGRYRQAKLQGVNSGFLFQRVIAPIAGAPALQFPRVAIAILRRDPALASATAEQFAQRLADLRAQPAEAAKEAARLIPVIEQQLRQQYRQHVKKVSGTGLFSRSTMTISPEDVPNIQQEVARRAGIELPAVPKHDVLGNEHAAQQALDRAYEEVFAAQRRLVDRVTDITGDFDVSRQLEDVLSQRDPNWLLPSAVYSAACQKEGSLPEVQGRDQVGREASNDLLN